jgi:acetyl esterase/lipase
VALLALDKEYLKKYDIPTSAIRGVAALSGVYDVHNLDAFKPGEGKRDASPMLYVHAPAPPFLITYAQWDYLELPKQARDFAAALKKDFVPTELVYIPGESHITEIVDIVKDDDPTARAILNFIK